jgi:hypothetical protein
MIIALMVTAMIVFTIYRFVSAHLMAINTTMDIGNDRDALNRVVKLLQTQLDTLPVPQTTIMQVAPGPAGNVSTSAPNVASQTAAALSGSLTGKAYKFRGLSNDEITWICPAGSGLLTTGANGEFEVTLTVQPVSESSSETELGLRRRPAAGNKVNVELKRGGDAGRYDWLPLIRRDSLLRCRRPFLGRPMDRCRPAAGAGPSAVAEISGRRSSGSRDRNPLRPNRSMKTVPTHRSGSALLIVLWALLLLSAATFAWAVWIQQRIVAHGEEGRAVEARVMARSGMTLALHPQVTRITPMPPEELVPGAGYEVRNRGEGGKLNINWLMRGEVDAPGAEAARDRGLHGLLARLHRCRQRQAAERRGRRWRLSSGKSRTDQRRGTGQGTWHRAADASARMAG